MASRNTSFHLSVPCSSSVSRKAIHRSSRTPSSSHSTSRRQHVLAEGNPSGRSRQRAPVLRTHKIPSRHSRSPARGRPPFREASFTGRYGLILSHCQSSNIRGRDITHSFVCVHVSQLKAGRKITSVEVLKPALGATLLTTSNSRTHHTSLPPNGYRPSLSHWHSRYPDRDEITDLFDHWKQIL